MTRATSAIIHAGWWTAYLLTILLASTAMPVNCRCGDLVVAPRALITATALIAPRPVPDEEAAPGVHAASERVDAGETPTTVDWGLAFVAVITFLAAVSLPRAAALAAVARRLLAVARGPLVPPPRAVVPHAV